MNHIVISQLSDFTTIINASITITDDKKKFDDEAQENMWLISFDERMIKSITLQNLTTFIDALIHKKKQQLSEHYLNIPVTFYVWFDEMAGQLRFNLVSGHIKPPFGCSLEITHSVQEILKECITAQNHIPWEELEDIDQDFDEDAYTLRIYVLYL